MKTLTRKKAKEMSVIICSQIGNSTDQIWSDNYVIATQTINRDNSVGNWNKYKEKLNPIFLIGCLRNFGETRKEAIEAIKREFPNYYNGMYGVAIYLEENGTKYYIDEIQTEENHY